MKLLLSIFIILFSVFFYGCSERNCDSDYDKCESNCRDNYEYNSDQYWGCHDDCWDKKTDCEDCETFECYDFWEL